jgi:hypothetical protein
VDLEGIRQGVGPEFYDAVRRWRWAPDVASATALIAHDSYGSAAPDPDAPDLQQRAYDTAFDLYWRAAEMVFDDWEETDLETKLDLWFTLYREVPSYPALFSIALHADIQVLTPYMLERYREFIGDEREEIAAPAVYSLKVDYFERRGSDELWTAFVEGPMSHLALERLLRAADSVCWELKAPVYRRVIGDKSFHAALFESFHGCVYNACGDFKAAELLSFLDDPGFEAPDREHAAKLRDRVVALANYETPHHGRAAEFRQRHGR